MPCSPSAPPPAPPSLPPLLSLQYDEFGDLETTVEYNIARAVAEAHDHGCECRGQRWSRGWGGGWGMVNAWQWGGVGLPGLAVGQLLFRLLLPPPPPLLLLLTHLRA